MDRKKPLIVPVFLPHHGCPHRCIFCDQTAITGSAQKRLDDEQIQAAINQFLNYRTLRRDLVQIAFFGGNFLGLKPDRIQSLLGLAAAFVRAGNADSIRFSTRPDTVDDQRLRLIEPFPVAAIEIGAQSMDDHVLALADRGHTAGDTQTAVARLKARNYQVGLQMMVGLPGDDEVRALDTGQKMVDLAPDFVRIYPTLVLANSPLARWYQNGTYSPWSLERSVAVVKDLFLLFEKNRIRVIRMGLQPTEDLQKDVTVLAGPYHPAFGHLVHSEIFRQTAIDRIKADTGNHDAVTVRIHPRSISKMRGLNNSNIRWIKKTLNLKSLKIVGDPNLSENGMMVCPDRP